MHPAPRSLPAAIWRAFRARLADRVDRSATAATFALLRWLPLRTTAAGQAPSVDDVIYARALLTRLIATFFALAVLSIAPAFATAEGEQGTPQGDAPVQCVAADGSLVPAPAGSPAGAPAPCPQAAPEEPPPLPPVPTEEPAPATPTPEPAPVEAPPTPQATIGGTPTATPTVGGVPSKPKAKPQASPKGEKKAKSKREHGTGPDDHNPPAPPSSLLRSPAPTATGPSSGGPIGEYVLPAPTTRGVPNILLDGFRVPPFLLPIYQAAGVQYGVRWEVLAAINSIETDYGRNLNVSTAGALGWMQFMPGTWAGYGVDANNDGRRDPYNPVDAIFAAARYLRAAGAAQDLRKAIWAYNHADWYVNDVLRRAHALSALPPEVVASLSGMTLGRFPVAAPATYAGRLSTRAAHARISSGNASIPVEGGTRRGRRIFAEAGAPVVAVQDSRVVALGSSPRLGTFIRLRDVYGNTYTYGHLATLATVYPVPRPRKQSLSSIRRELGVAASDPTPRGAATAGGHRDHATTAARLPRPALRALHPDVTPATAFTPTPAPAPKPTPAPRLATATATPLPAAELISATAPGLALPALAPLHPQATPQPAQTEPVVTAIPAGVSAFRAVFAEPEAIDRRDVVLRPLRRGAKVIGGTVIGRIGAASLGFAPPQGADAEAEQRAESAAAARQQTDAAPHLYFEVRPAGKKTPRIDPKPLLDGWRLLDSTAIYRAQNPVLSAAGTERRLSIGEIMLMSKEQLMRHVLDNPDIAIYECGRADIRAGTVDRRILASLEFLAARGMKPTVTSLRCGHGFLTASGNVSEHSSGDAVDIAAINGVPIAGHQGPGSITDRAVRALLTLQGTMKPHQIITLMQYAGTDNTLALADHWDHIHVGFHPNEDAVSMLRPDQWDRLVSGLGRIRNPVVPIRPSRWSIAVTKRAPKAVAQARHDAADRPRVG